VRGRNCCGVPDRARDGALHTRQMLCADEDQCIPQEGELRKKRFRRPQLRQTRYYYRTVCDNEDVYWKECTEYESLYYCSDEGKEHVQTGTQYRRIPTATGMCLGDASTPASLERVYGVSGVDLQASSEYGCPAGFAEMVQGKWCKCNEACGKK